MFYVFEEINWRWFRHNRPTAPLSHIMSTVSDGVSPSPKWGGGEPVGSHLHASYSEVPSTEHTDWKKLAYIIPPSSQDFHLQSFFPRTVRDWNILPQETVQLGSCWGLQTGSSRHVNITPSRTSLHFIVIVYGATVFVLHSAEVLSLHLFICTDSCHHQQHST